MGDGGKFFRGFQQILDDDGRIQALAFHCRRTAELAGGDLHIVGSKGSDNIFNGQANNRSVCSG